MIQLPIIDAEWQTFEILLGDERWRFELTYNRLAERFVMRIQINDQLLIEGRKLVEFADLIGQFRFGKGRLFLIRYDETATEPDYRSVVRGRFRLYYMSEEEWDTVPEPEPVLGGALLAGSPLLTEDSSPVLSEESSPLLIDGR